MFYEMLSTLCLKLTEVTREDGERGVFSRTHGRDFPPFYGILKLG
jgi:hypothetical protein